MGLNSILVIFGVVGISVCIGWTLAMFGHKYNYTSFRYVGLIVIGIAVVELILFGFSVDIDSSIQNSKDISVSQCVQER